MRRARSEAGFSLLEITIVAVLLALVVGALMDPMVLALRTQLRDTNYAFSQQEARTGLDGMVSQVRQATSILSTGPNEVEMNVNLNGSSVHVQYECDVPQTGTTYRECIRVQSAAGIALPSLSTGSVVIRNLVNGTGTNGVFSFAPDPVAPYYMTATIQVPASDGSGIGLNHAVTFSDGALMRNLNVGN